LSGCDNARVTLSRHFATLAGRQLRRALAQVVFTASDFPGIELVRFRTEVGALRGFDHPLTMADFSPHAPG
jgi:hypothetical protein